MRKFYLAILLLFVFTGTLQAQNWMPMGPRDQNQPSYSQADNPRVATAPDGTIYTAFKDVANANKITVQKYFNGSWELVGAAGFSSLPIVYSSIAVAPDGTPYVVFQTQNGGDAFALDATVMKFTAGVWSLVGTTSGLAAQQFVNNTTASTPTVAIAVAPNNEPYVAFQDYNAVLSASVRRFNGTNWVNVGVPGFSGLSFALGISLAISEVDGTPYVLFGDSEASPANSSTVMKFNGTIWVLVGTKGFSGSAIQYPSIALTIDGIPYVAYQHFTSGSKASVRQFNGTSWDLVGPSVGISAGEAQFVSLAISGPLDYTPYLAYKDVANGNKAILKKFDGSAWVNAGTAGFSTGAVQYTSVAINASNQPYVIYQDGANGLKATVKVLDTDWVQLGAEGLSNGRASFISSAYRSSNASLYVAYRDNLNTASVRRYTAGAWSLAGSAGFSGVAANNISLAISPLDGTPYVAFNEEVAGQARVYFLAVDNAWTQLPVTGFSSEVINYTNMAVAADGTPYIAYAEADPVSLPNNNRANVKRYNGTSWVSVGATDFSTTAANYLSFAFSPSGVPHVAYQNGTSGQALLMQFNGSSWVQIGTAISSGAATFTSLAFTSDGTPYVAYNDGTANKLIVKRFTSGSWVAVGPVGGLSAGASSEISLEIGANNIPFVAYRDGASGNRLTVKKFDSGTWVNADLVGGDGFSAGPVSGTSLVIAPDNVPYITFTDGYAWAEVLSSGSTPVPVTLVSFTATKQNGKSLLNWQTASEFNSDHFVIEHSVNGIDFTEIGKVNAQGSSNRLVNYQYLHVNPAKGSNYYRLRQVDIDNKEEIYPIRLVQFNYSELNLITIYPNPVKTDLSIRTSQSGVRELVIVNMSGQQVIQQKVNTTEMQFRLNVSNLKSGSYILIVNALDGRSTMPFIKQ